MNKYFKQALRGVISNPSRTFLTTLGIMIGIGTVVLVLSIGEGFKSYVNAQVDTFGSNLIIIETTIPSSSKNRSEGVTSSSTSNVSFNAIPVTTLKNKDIKNIRDLSNVKDAYGAALGQKVSTYQNVSKNTFIFGSDASRFDIDKGVIEVGRPYTEREDRSLAQVAVLGHDIAVDFFGQTDPIGKRIRVGSYNFEVIGVYERRGSFGFSNDDQQIFIPLKTLQKKILGIDYLYYSIVELVDNDQADSSLLDISETLRRNHYISDPAKDDFRILTQEQSLDIFDVILNAITFLLLAIAAISLIVGGVGVMNIMYVVVTERIGEIGLKKALGARNKDILLEFLTEAVLLTVIGGIVGILGGAFLGFLTSIIAQKFGLQWEFAVPLWGIFLSFFVSMAIGVFFGVFPAKNAGKLDPIQALNKE